MSESGPQSETDVVEVSTGEVKLLGGRGVLSAAAIGSCIAVVALDREVPCGGIAHVMLPGRARREGDPQKTRYAEDAIEELLRRLARFGTDPARLQFYLVGAGNVLQRADDTVCAGNISSVTGILDSRRLALWGLSLGGTRRRRVRLHLPSGRIECAIGDAPFAFLDDGAGR